MITPREFFGTRLHRRWAALLVPLVAGFALFTATADAGTFGVKPFADATGFLSRETENAPALVIKTAKPKPIAGKGYHRAFRDNFDTLGSTAWGKGTWYDPGSPAKAIFVRNGVLNLVSRRSQGYPDITLSSESARSRGCSSAGTSRRA